MNNNPVSVIIPTYNRAYCLRDSIDSVLAQTYKDFELIIVDDGSTDDTAELIASYDDPRIRYIVMEENGGQSKARNRGLQESTGELIAFHDSDDRWHADKLEKMVPLFEKSEIGFAYHKLRYDLGEGRAAILPDERIPLAQKSGHIFAQLLYDNMIDMPALMLRRRAYETVGPLDESLSCLEDYEYALRLSMLFQAGFCDEILLESTMSADGVSSKSFDYIRVSCELVSRYKSEYIRTNTLNHRLEVILTDSQRLGILDQVGPLLEKIMVL